LSRTKQNQPVQRPAPNARRFSGADVFAIVFGLFLGLALLKFGNPVILAAKISPPKNSAEFRDFAWPPGWSVWFLVPIAVAALVLVFTKRPRWPASKWLWILPIGWFAWQLISATRTVDPTLTRLAVLHFGGLIACYFIGTFLLSNARSQRLVLLGLLAAFAFCLVRAVDQKLIEFPAEKRFLTESERSGWTNLPPELVFDLKQQGTIIATNGVDIANPALVKKYEKGRVFGTLVYPNALAGIILLLLPVSLVFAINGTRPFRAITRTAAITLTLFLGLGALFWTGSKSGWLIAMVLLGGWLFRLNWSAKLKWLTLGLVLILGIGAFGVRFRSYFAAGATSVGARFDYWRAAVKTTAAHPVFGTGPGTFQRPYAQIKAPEAEMARLTHNDYLEQFSDGGVPSGVLYATWIVFLASVLVSLWKKSEPVTFAIALGGLGWFIQGFSEFSLYVPALSWTAFALAGSLVGLRGNQIDKADVAR
jgi:O-antigen ligase